MPVQQITLTEIEAVAATESECCKTVELLGQQVALWQTRLTAAQAALVTATAARRPMLVTIAQAHSVTPANNAALDVVESPPGSGTYKLTITT